jgi:hypothetical protein
MKMAALHCVHGGSNHVDMLAGVSCKVLSCLLPHLRVMLSWRQSEESSFVAFKHLSPVVGSNNRIDLRI